MRESKLKTLKINKQLYYNIYGFPLTHPRIHKPCKMSKLLRHEAEADVGSWLHWTHTHARTQARAHTHIQNCVNPARTGQV